MATAYAANLGMVKTHVGNTDEPLVNTINKFWKGSILEGKGRLLVDECSRSSVPRACAKVIAAQTWYETKFGTLGSGTPPRRNLTGIKGSGPYREYKKYDDSIKDSVRLFIDGKYQDYFTLYGFEDGLCKSLAKWGTRNCSQIKGIIGKM